MFVNIDTFLLNNTQAYVLNVLFVSVVFTSYSF